MVVKPTILIGGTSHAGKTTLGKAVASRLNWRYLSTDSLARHPGRPWSQQSGEVPKHVRDHYLSFSTEELFEDVLRHYKKIWPLTCVEIVANVAEQGQVIEGSALWPDLVASILTESVYAVWLTASDKLLRERIYSQSGFMQADEDQQKLISKFLERSIYFNQQMLKGIAQHNLQVIKVDVPASLIDYADDMVRTHREM